MLDSRGGIILAFAQVEWFMAKLIVEAAGFEQYLHLDLSFTQDAAKRADRLTNILSTKGPISPYADELKSIIGRILKHENLRNFAAHGLLVRPDDITLDSKLHFRLYRMYKGGNLVEETLDLTLKEYTDQTSELTGAAREFITVVRKIWAELKLPPLDDSKLILAR
ncbi:hypothetical protein DXH78_19250 [Undibacter mobilis]|uniref:MAE-28990/MAE-18760-like HEPN domain-containing protein n=1 Tax=Undibacter mobilis TaxID=2292256 RepID=A0A371B1M5_9BRAD|nr:hypothetical protein DXH78_19250 [Undibacter mobilis]